MALKGTLKDFGIAEILQLIGQQMKSGVLHLESHDEEIHIALSEGSVVRAEQVGRKANERLGAMLVRAEVISQPELDQGLDLQRRTLRRLGDILVDLGSVSREDLREITHLQTTETIYRLFHWKSGTYEFEAGGVEWDRETAAPLRAESVLMEGFRRVDEWPIVRKRIPSLQATFERKKDLPLEAPGGDGGDEAELASIGLNERRVYLLTTAGRTAEKVVDLSRLGEFETCKALANLVNHGYLTLVAPTGRSRKAGGHSLGWKARLKAGAVRAFSTLAIAAALGGLATWVDRSALASGGQRGAPVEDGTPRNLASRYGLARLRGALETYRAERGGYPERLAELAEVGLVSRRELASPWREEYFYRRRPEGAYVLLPPLD
jgi:hypothetical protein